jgi:hypothetical protein
LEKRVAKDFNTGDRIRVSVAAPYYYSGQTGSILLIAQAYKHGELSYKVRFDDGSEFWYSSVALEKANER